MKKGKVVLIAIGVLILVIAVTTLIEYLRPSNRRIIPTKEEKTEVSIIAVGQNENNSYQLLSINNEGKTEELKNKDVFSIDGIGGRSFDYYNDKLFYLDQEYNMHIKDLITGKETVDSVKEDIQGEDMLNMYAGENNVVLIDSNYTYIYNIKTKEVSKMNLKVNMVDNAYYNSDNNTLYMHLADRRIHSINLDTKEDKIIGGDYYVNPASNDKYLVISDSHHQDNNSQDIYLFDYETSKMKKAVSIIEGKVIRLNGSTIIYTSEDKIISKPLDGVEREIFKSDNNQDIYYTGASSKDIAIIGLLGPAKNCSDTCGEEVERVLLFNFKDNKTTELHNDLKVTEIRNNK